MVSEVMTQSQRFRKDDKEQGEIRLLGRGEAEESEQV